MKTFWRTHKPSRRRLIQVYAALLYNANLKGFVHGRIYTGPIKNLCVPGLNCYSCPGAAGACPLGALQNALAASGNRAPYYVLGILMLLGLTLGRTICGWLCPMGMLQELLHKLPTPKLPKSRMTRMLSWVKYIVLAVFVIILPFISCLQRIPLPAFCKYICPAGTLEGTVGLLAHPANAGLFSVLGSLFSWKVGVLIFIVIACVFVYRGFCRFLCPLGAIYSLFAKVSMLGVTVSEPTCTHCDRCVRQCRMDIRHVGDHECIHCGECIPVCPTQAITWKGGKLRLHANETTAPVQSKQSSRKPWLYLAAVLLLSLWTAVIFLTDSAPSDAPAESIQEQNIGAEVGCYAPDFTVPLYDGGTFTLSQQRGKVTVINFWATWCAPCVKELPHFQQLSQRYPEDVSLVAIHASLVTEDVPAYLAQTDWTIPFALDVDGQVIQSLGGSTLLPMTVVLDADGRIVYNQVGSLTPESLEAIVAPLLGS